MGGFRSSAHCQDRKQPPVYKKWAGFAGLGYLACVHSPSMCTLCFVALLYSCVLYSCVC